VRLDVDSWYLIVEYRVLNLMFFFYFLKFSGPIHFVMLLKDSWPIVFIILVHDARGIEVLFEVLKALDTPIFNITFLFRIEHGPFPSLEFFLEIHNISGVLVVDRQVEKVIFSLMIFIDFLQ